MTFSAFVSARAARQWRTGGTVVLAGVLALALAACGSSSTPTTTATSTIGVGDEPSSTATQSAPASTSASTAGTPASTSTYPTTTTATTPVPTTTTTAAAAYPAGCKSVPTPVPHGAQSIPKPTLKLSPAKTYTVTLQTNCGPIAIKLATAQAPITDASFAYLVKRGFYNGLTFHRIVAGFMVQGGDPLGTGLGGPGYFVVDAPPASLKYTVGTVAMAKTSAQASGTSGSQFFIVVGPEAASLPAQYALVGHVVGSTAALNAIADVPVSVGSSGEDSMPDLPVVIARATLKAS